MARSAAVPKGIPVHMNDLEGMRGFMAALVVGSHLVYLENAHSFWFGQLLSWIWPCMDVFFCMSGYFIGRQVLEKIHLRDFWPVYFQRRALRIWPVYFAALFVTAGASLAFSHLKHETSFLQQTNAWWTFLLFVQFSNLYVAPHAFPLDGTLIFLHSWSVALEEQFYVIVPAYIALLIAVARFRHSQLRKWTLAAVFVIPPLASLILRFAGIPMFVLGARTEGFVAGILIAWLQQCAAGFPEKLLRARDSMRRLLPISILAINLFGLLQVFLVYDDGPADFSRLSYPLGATFTGLVAGVIVAACVFGASPRMSRFFAMRPFPFLGRMSFSTYMWHFPIIGLLSHLLALSELPYLVVIAVVLFIAYGVSYLSYRYIELPMARLKPRFHRDLAAKSTSSRLSATTERTSLD